MQITAQPDDTKSKEREDVDELVRNLIGPTNSAPEQPRNVLPAVTTGDTAKVATESKDNQVSSRKK